MTSPEVNEDFEDLIGALVRAECDFLIVGAHALAMHGIPRATAALDVFVRPSSENALKVVEALEQFGPPLQAHGISADDFSKPGVVYQLGLPPRRIDLLTQISGATFDEASQDAMSGQFGRHPVKCIGLQALLLNKRSTGRTKDIADAEQLESRLQALKK